MLKNIFRRSSVVLGLIVVVLALSACSAPTAQIADDEPSEAAATVQHELSSIPTNETGAARWSVPAQGVVGVALDASASTSAVLSKSLLSGYEVSLFDSDGETLGFARIGGRHWTTAQVRLAESGARAITTLSGGNDRDRVHVLDRDGSELWTIELESGSNSGISPDGEVVYTYNRNSESMVMYSATGRLIYDFATTGQPSVQFVGQDHSVVVADDTQISLVDASGKVLWKYPLNRDLTRRVLMAGNGENIAVATGQADSMVYLFTKGGKAQWKYPLQFGGTHRLSFSPDSTRLAVYDVGPNAGVYLFDVTAGKLQSVSKFSAGSGHKLAATSLRFADDMVVITVVDTFKNLLDEDVSIQYLVAISSDGEPQWKVNLRGNTRAALSGDGETALVATLGSGDEWSVELYDLPPGPAQ